MTLASEAIQRAHRESNLIAAGASPTTTQAAEGLVLLNNILTATLGFAAGEELTDINIGGEHDQAWTTNDYIPQNARLVLNLTSSRTLNLHPSPYEGQRVAIVDTGGNLATANLTLDGNGRRIESATTAVLSTNSLSREWFYRADTGNWTRLAVLSDSDSLPFPGEFDDYFIILLAMRLNPRFGRQLAVESSAWLQSTSARLEARYRRPRPVQDWGSLGLLDQSRAYEPSGFWNPLA